MIKVLHECTGCGHVCENDEECGGLCSEMGGCYKCGEVITEMAL